MRREHEADQAIALYADHLLQRAGTSPAGKGLAQPAGDEVVVTYEVERRLQRGRHRGRAVGIALAGDDPCVPFLETEKHAHLTLSEQQAADQRGEHVTRPHHQHLVGVFHDTTTIY